MSQEPSQHLEQRIQRDGSPTPENTPGESKPLEAEDNNDSLSFTLHENNPMLEQKPQPLLQSGGASESPQLQPTYFHVPPVLVYMFPNAPAPPPTPPARAPTPPAGVLTPTGMITPIGMQTPPAGYPAPGGFPTPPAEYPTPPTGMQTPTGVRTPTGVQTPAPRYPPPPAGIQTPTGMQTPPARLPIRPPRYPIRPPMPPPPIVSQPMRTVGTGLPQGWPTPHAVIGGLPSNAELNHPNPAHDMSPAVPSISAAMFDMNSDIPPGLRCLSTLNELLVHQRVQILEILTGFENKNKYTVMNKFGQELFYAGERSSVCARLCCKHLRPFSMILVDHTQQEVIHFKRPLRCESCCFPGCLQVMEVMAPPGVVIGCVEQTWSCFKPNYVVKNLRGDVELLIRGPICQFSICRFRNVEFGVYTANGERQVGKITKQWAGLAREFFTDADVFGISFPRELDHRMKATLLGACFLIASFFICLTKLANIVFSPH